jgi:vacuolar-type H+-ATPase subunit D/Vma8
MPREYEQLTWYGRGPWDNYPDRKVSCPIGLWKSTVSEQYVDYPRPQDSGNHEDCTLVELKDVEIERKKVAGVVVPVLTNIRLEAKPFGIFSAPKWYFDGIKLLHGLAKTAVEREFAVAKQELLDHARRKTTQKVNLFEKVQIPGFQEAVRKIKRFMEDEENLSKSSQKILKSLQEKRAVAEEEEARKEDAA